MVPVPIAGNILGEATTSSGNILMTQCEGNRPSDYRADTKHAEQALYSAIGFSAFVMMSAERFDGYTMSSDAQRYVVIRKFPRHLVDPEDRFAG